MCGGVWCSLRCRGIALNATGYCCGNRWVIRYGPEVWSERKSLRFQGGGAFSRTVIKGTVKLEQNCRQITGYLRMREGTLIMSERKGQWGEKESACLGNGFFIIAVGKNRPYQKRCQLVACGQMPKDLGSDFPVVQ